MMVAVDGRGYRESNKAPNGRRVDEQTIITEIITAIICHSMGKVHNSGTVIADHEAAP